MERRKFIRFPVDLKIETSKNNKEINPGFVRDFSQEGLRAVFDEFEFEPGSAINFKIQYPNSEIFIPGSALTVWKRWIDEKCNVGFLLKEFPPAGRAEILEYGYSNWLKQNTP